MTDAEPPSELVTRLHSLRISKGLTIQQMADKCGIPKSSLESYMKTFGAKRPGIDALLSIANGMDVSIDWLVGRAVDSHSARLTQKDYALAVFAVVSGLVNWMRERQEASQVPIIEKGKVAGVEDAQVAAKAMLEFVDRVNLFNDTAHDGRDTRTALFDGLYNRARKEQPATK